ncbi:translation initiation factor if-2 [Lasius niger]|uniref:Translation initiation factor if-2 n=1 Tax=Lasius niger TaxID=67767 RepID=A0A0J7L1U5_LASNI|nr:translation initiation factor if-2 [Lasius niger]
MVVEFPDPRLDTIGEIILYLFTKLADTSTHSTIMLKHVVLLSIVFCSVQSQRPWHAGNSSNRLPQVLPQYIDERIAAEQAAQAAQAGTTNQAGITNQAGSTNQAGTTSQAGTASQVDTTNQIGQGTQTVGTFGTDLLGNRIGGSAGAPAPSTTTTIIPYDLPVDAHGDVDLVNRIKTWPRDKQPFWYINWQAIQAHRGDANNSAQPVQTQPNPMSFFAG